MKLGIILGDQLSLSLPTLRGLDPKHDRILMAEVRQEATYVQHHKQKIALLFSAMRHFAHSLQQAGWEVEYVYYSPSGPASLQQAIARSLQQQPATDLVLTRCGEYRLQQMIDQQWPQQLNLPVTVYEDDRFIASPAEFAHWAQNRKQLRKKTAPCKL